MNVSILLRCSARLAAVVILGACSAGGSLQSPQSGMEAMPKLAAPQSARAPVAPRGLNDQILYSFEHGAGGDFPNDGGLVANDRGDLFGTTGAGGSYDSYCDGLQGCGTVFELVRSGKRYAEKVLWAFAGPPDGSNPYDMTLLRDRTGALFGTTILGGTTGLGTVFALTPGGNSYTERVMYSFTANDGGGGPAGGVVSDARGNLYGTTAGFISSLPRNGVVYELPATGGEKVLYAFQNNGSDGTSPYGALVIGRDGSLFGTTSGGGTYGFGTIFKLSRSGSSYHERVLYSFGSNANDGKIPLAGLVADGRGALYGTTVEGGSASGYGGGTVFELTKSGRAYKERILYAFGQPPDGAAPQSTLTLKRGYLYGTTFSGGADSLGTVFRISRTGVEKILHSFAGGDDGAFPEGSVLPGESNRFFGTTVQGGDPTCTGSGANGCGTVFALR